MKILSEEFIQLNIKEKQFILSQIRNKYQKEFYTDLFRQEKIPFIFIYDIITFIDKESNVYKDLISAIRIGEKISISLDKKCTKMMKDFQKESFKSLELLLSTQSYIKGFMIFDEPGLGKTLTSLCLTKGYYRSFDLEIDDIPLVVVVPKTLIKQWVTSISKLYPNKKVSTNLDSKSNIYVINFEKVSELKSIFTSGCVTIIDEAHLLHNIQSNRYQEIFEFIKYYSAFTILLTGTPIRESIIDLFSLYSLISNNIKSIDLLVRIKEYLLKYKYTNRFILSLIESTYIRNVKKEIFDNVGRIIMKPLVIDVDTFLFKKYKLGLDQIDSRFKDSIEIIQKYKQIVSSNNKIKVIDEIIHQINNKNDLIKLLERYDVDQKYHKIILEYFELIFVKSKQSLKSKIWQELLDNTLLFILNNHINELKVHHMKYKKVLVVTKSRKIIDSYINKMKSKGINGITIESSDSYSVRYNKIKMFEQDKSINFLISTYPIIEAGLDMPFIDNIFILDFPFRPHSLIQIANRKQRLQNISENINITFLKVSYPYNIIDHHRMILLEVYRTVQKILNKINDKG